MGDIRLHRESCRIFYNFLLMIMRQPECALLCVFYYLSITRQGTSDAKSFTNVRNSKENKTSKCTLSVMVLMQNGTRSVYFHLQIVEERSGSFSSPSRTHSARIHCTC